MSLLSYRSSSRPSRSLKEGLSTWQENRMVYVNSPQVDSRLMVPGPIPSDLCIGVVDGNKALIAEKRTPINLNSVMIGNGITSSCESCRAHVRTLKDLAKPIKMLRSRAIMNTSARSSTAYPSRYRASVLVFRWPKPYVLSWQSRMKLSLIHCIGSKMSSIHDERLPRVT